MRGAVQPTQPTSGHPTRARGGSAAAAPSAARSRAPADPGRVAGGGARRGGGSGAHPGPPEPRPPALRCAFWRRPGLPEGWGRVGGWGSWPVPAGFLSLLRKNSGCVKSGEFFIFLPFAFLTVRIWLSNNNPFPFTLPTPAPPPREDRDAFRLI